MKNIIVFTIFVIIATAIFPAAAYSSQNSEQEAAKENTGYGFSVGPQVGFAYGQAIELVYSDGRNEHDLLSELKWDMKPIFYAGVEANFERRDIMSRIGFFSSVSFKAGIPVVSGYLENKDWQSMSHSNLTDFSKHTNKTREFLWLDIAAGISIPIISLFYIKPFINGSWMRFAFSGKDGYGEYQHNTNTYFEVDFTGLEVIRYEQKWLLAAAGLEIGTNALYPFSFDLSLKISPLTYCAARDDHLYPSNEFTFLDYTLWGLFIEPAVNLSMLLDKAEISFNFAYRHIGYTRGQAYSTPYGLQRYSHAGEAGAGLSLYKIRLVAKYLF